MKKLFFLLILLLTFASCYAGDVANLVMLCFSKDGTKVAFGVHGVQDKTYQAYAEIYLVDSFSNDFLSNGVFKTSPTKATYALDSKSVFLSLQNRAMPYLKKYNISEENQGRPLYSKTEDNVEENTLIFRDFETNSEYNVTLHSQTNGYMQSSFHITCNVITANGNKKTYTVGHPEIVRAGIKGYEIKRVIVDATGSTLVFIIEKKEHEKGGDSVRYMAEVIRL